MADERQGQMGEGSESRLGRRAFLGVLLGGAAALVAGRLFFGGDEDRLPLPKPGFRIRSVEPGPPFEPAVWNLQVEGLVRRPVALDWEAFNGLPQVRLVRDFQCVEGWRVEDVTWTGTSVRTLMEQADIDPRATHLAFYSGDGVYSSGLTLQEAFEEDVLLAYRIEGQSLPPEQGEPLRVVVPGSYGYKYVKWVTRVVALDEAHIGYWEERGYPNNAAIR